MRSMAFVVMLLLTTKAFAFGNGVEVGGVLFEPKLSLTAKQDDNVLRTESNPVSSEVTIIRPELGLKLGNDVNNTVMNLSVEQGEYSTSAGDNYRDYFADIAYHNSATSQYLLDAGASYVVAHDPRGSNKAIAVSAKPDRWDESSAFINYGFNGKKSEARFAMDVAYKSRHYRNNRALTESRDLNKVDSGVAFFYHVGGKTSALIEARYAQFDYPLTTSLLDSSELSLYTGVKWEATAKTTGTVKAGWQEKTFKDSAQKKKGFASWDASVTWSPLSYSTWEMGTFHKSSESYGTKGFLKTTNANLRWNHEWSKRFRHSIGVGYTENKDSVDSLWKEQVTNSDIHLTYDMNSWLSVEAAYVISDLVSTVTGSSYNKNEVSFTLAGKL